MPGNLSAWQRELVAAHMPYVRALVAREWQQSNKELQADLVQQGYLALVDAALRYDPVKYPTTTFIGYSKWRVRKYIQEYQRMDYQIRPPWKQIKGKGKPELQANQPLQSDDEIGGRVLDRYGDEDPGYASFEDKSEVDWLNDLIDSFGPRVRALYYQWMLGTLDWSDVSKEEQEALYVLDTEIGEGTC